MAKHDRYDEDSRDGNRPFWGHSDGLFDQDEDAYGEKYDLATGIPFDNSTDSLDSLGLTEQAFIDMEDENRKDVELIDRHYSKLGEGLADAAGISDFLEDIA